MKRKLAKFMCYIVIHSYFPHQLAVITEKTQIILKTISKKKNSTQYFYIKLNNLNVL